MSTPNPDCAGRDRPHEAHRLASPGGGNKPGAWCDGLEEVDEFDTGCTDECGEDCMADHRGEE